MIYFRFCFNLTKNLLRSWQVSLRIPFCFKEVVSNASNGVLQYHWPLSLTTSKEPWKLHKLTLPVLKLAFNYLFKFYSEVLWFIWFSFLFVPVLFSFFHTHCAYLSFYTYAIFCITQCKKRHYFTGSKGGQLNEASLFFLNVLKGMQTLPEWESYHLRRAFKGKTDFALALARVKKTQKIEFACSAALY